MEGYDDLFLGGNARVGIPDYKEFINDIALNKETDDHVLDYTYYSVIQSRIRRVPILSASNIYRIKFNKIPREGVFKPDERINDDEQLTSKDYTKFNTIVKAAIHKGHMTKREDVQWDMNGNEDNSLEAAKSTFFYPNAAPQHARLNNGPWKHLENSIIIKGRVPEPAKVSVFTGPVLDDIDPEFKVKLSDRTTFKISVLFWKVIFYVKEDGNLYKAGFLMGQMNPLREDKLINEITLKGFEKEVEKSSVKPFLEFKEDENYQVPVSLIEELTKLKFQYAIDRHANIKPSVLKLEEVQIKGFGDDFSEQIPSFEVNNLIV